ncbi:MAG: maleylpyruvate isomerase family mycothiol-dependent enzyme [Chloroflexota bacterium]
MVSAAPAQVFQSTAAVPAVTAGEAYRLLQVQLQRLLDLLDSLSPEDWSRPTACSAWDVRAMVAHQAGGYASGTGYREMLRQYLAILKPGGLPEDRINALQVGERSGRTPAELIAELRAAGPTAARNWAYGFRLVRWGAIPHPVAGLLSLGHLNRVVHSRDTWMHRLDICRATGRPFVQTPEQEGRIAALVMPDVEKALRRKLGPLSLRFDLNGVCGGTWQMGEDPAAASIHMDALDFFIFASGRYTPAEARARARVSGNSGAGEAVFNNLLVLF